MRRAYRLTLVPRAGPLLDTLMIKIPAHTAAEGLHFTRLYHGDPWSPRRRCSRWACWRGRATACSTPRAAPGHWWATMRSYGPEAAHSPQQPRGARPTPQLHNSNPIVLAEVAHEITAFSPPCWGGIGGRVA